MNIRNHLATLVCGLGLLLSSANADAHTVVVVRTPPPARVEVVGPRPAVDMMWVAGHWDANWRGWQWVPGHWQRIERTWVPGHYTWEGRRQVWIGGHYR